MANDNENTPAGQDALMREAQDKIISFATGVRSGAIRGFCIVAQLEDGTIADTSWGTMQAEFTSVGRTEGPDDTTIPDPKPMVEAANRAQGELDLIVKQFKAKNATKH